ncbi:unnamed protein product [Polarella glacialis]|uniref:C3H1-type domain-containing protein n=1 Tax=Polarella glacialis TaxID=89957 RepID=A0A813IMH0_POLGL|nr:unnamed protein product [Polarella glacialis]
MQGLGGAQQWSPPVQQAQSWRAPVTQSWGAPAAPAAAPARGGFKTRLCNYFLQGLCTKGAGCSFAHGPHELSGGAAAMGKGQAKGSWMMPQMGFMGGFAAKGMDKGKGKGKMGKGHTLPRQRVTDDPVTGEVVEWKGKYGWVMPSAPIEHEKASKHEGKIFVSKSDLVGVEELTVGSSPMPLVSEPRCGSSAAALPPIMSSEVQKGWVDNSKPPGCTRVEQDALQLEVCFPYDIQAAGSWSLYIRGFSKRKYRAGCYPTAGNMAHNLWYWSLGVLQWSLSECAMMHLWATGKVAYVSDLELLMSPRQMLLLAYVHSLHHRNMDPEPFSGIQWSTSSTFPTRWLVPTLYMANSPLIYMWIFLHLALAPGAGHSGWEDHWQADQYHYLHHAKFECNYGSPSSGWIDQLTGTFRELGSSEVYTGAYKGDSEAAAAEEKKVWSAGSYLGLQTGDHLIYTLFCLFTTCVLVWAAVSNPLSEAPDSSVLGVPLATCVASLVAYGPVAFAMLLCAFYDKMSWRWPFHKDRVVGSFGFFVLAGWLACLLPTYHFVHLLVEL